MNAILLVTIAAIVGIASVMEIQAFITVSTVKHVMFQSFARRVLMTRSATG